MPAKPQPMAGQSDAADDLIAELAKLMAQDAQGDSSAAPAAAPVYPIRIPGGDAPQPAQPQAKVDQPAIRSFNAQPAERPASAPVEAPRAPVVAPQAVDDLPEPFKFDFDFGPSKRAPVEPAVPPVATRPEPAAVSAAPSPAPAVAPAPDTADHDSIADLIAAELAVDIHPTPAPSPAPAATPSPAAPAMATPQPAPAPVAESRQPQPGAGWTPTTVATNLGAQQQAPRPALRAVNLQPVARSEQDRFKVPPVFGLATTPAKSVETVVPVAEPAPAPVPSAPIQSQPAFRPAASGPVVAAAPPASDAHGHRDPLNEIENLIGRAMRVEFDQPADEPAQPLEAVQSAAEPVVAPTPAPVEERPAPSPALRSLATPTVPVSAPSSLSAADEAVLAAAQATGAQVGWVEAPEVFDTEPSQRAPRARGARSLGMTRAVAGPLVAVTLLLAAGFGLYWALGLGGRDTSGVAPLLTADATPIKQVAPAAAADAAPPQQSVVFNEIDGVVPGAEEQLVSRDQTDVNEVTQVATATPDISEEGLANRKVRTVTVRPDGTIVSGDDSIAGSAILPVDRPNVPAVPGAETASPALLAAADPVTPVAAAPAAITTPAVTPVEPGATVPVVDLAGNPIAGRTAVVPLVRPAGLASAAPTAAAASPVNAIVDPVNAVIDAATAEVPAPAPVAAAPAEQPVAVPGATEVEALGNDAPAYVQLASQRSESEARQTAQAMVSRYGPLFGGANMEVQRVDLGAKGIYYRVRVPANSLEQANNICTNVKAAGGDCFTM